MRRSATIGLTFSLVALFGCSKGIDIKRDITFNFQKPVVVWFAPLTSEQKVHPFFRSTGFVADCFLIQAESEARANQLVEQQLPPDGFHLGWKFEPDPGITLGKVLVRKTTALMQLFPPAKVSQRFSIRPRECPKNTEALTRDSSGSPTIERCSLGVTPPCLTPWIGKYHER